MTELDDTVHSLEALLSIGRRRAQALAAEVTLPPKAAIEEIVDVGATALADFSMSARAAAHAAIARVVEADAEVERLQKEHETLGSVRDDPDGPYQADRLWLGVFGAALFVVVALGLAIALATQDLKSRPLEAALALALTTLLAVAAGEWSGRARRRRILAMVLLGLSVISLVAALVITANRPHQKALFALEVALLSTTGCAGYLTGRGRYFGPRLRESDRRRRMAGELVQAQQEEKIARGRLSEIDREYAGAVETIAERTNRAIEEYLRSIEDARIATTGVYLIDVPRLRAEGRQLVADWPRTLL